MFDNIKLPETVTYKISGEMVIKFNGYLTVDINTTEKELIDMVLDGDLNYDEHEIVELIDYVIKEE